MATKLDKDTWIVMPGLNEAAYLTRVLDKVLKYTKNIIFVDDGSSDETVSIAESKLKHVLVHAVNLGKGAALKTGCEYAFKTCKAKKVILMDSDDQHDAADLPRFEQQLSTKVPIVFGARAIDKDMPLFKRAANLSATYAVKLLFGWKYQFDIPSGFKGFSDRGYKKIAWDSPGYQVEIEIAARVAHQRIPFATLPIKTIYHDHDKGMTILNTLDLLYKLVLWRFTL